MEKQIKKPQGASAQNPSLARGKRMDPPAGKAEFPGRGLSNTKTKNSLPSKL